VSDLQKRGGYTPRRVREQRAYRLVMTGAITGGLGAIWLVIAIVAGSSATIPIILLIVAAICVVMFRRMTSA
jgi:hypothetical protein